MTRLTSDRRRGLAGTSRGTQDTGEGSYITLLISSSTSQYPYSHSLLTHKNSEIPVLLIVFFLIDLLRLFKLFKCHLIKFFQLSNSISYFSSPIIVK